MRTAGKRMVVVYRIEDASGRGPYYHYNGYTFWHTRNRPEQIEDDLFYWISRKRSMVCGFASKQQLDKWFNPDELKRLRRHGFTVRTFMIPACDIFYGKFQIAFWKPFHRRRKLSDDDLADLRYVDEDA